MKTSESKYCGCLYFTAAALARKVEKLAVESWKTVDLSPSHGYLLLAVLEEPGIQPSLLGDHLQLQPSTITRLMQKLEAQKLIVRLTEGKTVNVYPTQKAKELAPKMETAVAEFSEAYAKLLGKAEGDQLAKDIAAVADKLET